MAQLFADAARAYLSAGINNTDTTVSIAAGGSLFLPPAIASGFTKLGTIIGVNPHEDAIAIACCRLMSATGSARREARACGHRWRTRSC